MSGVVGSGFAQASTAALLAQQSQIEAPLISIPPSAAPTLAPDGSGVLTNLGNSAFFQNLNMLQRGQSSSSLIGSGTPSISGQQVVSSAISGVQNAVTTPSAQSAAQDMRVRIGALHPSDVYGASTSGILSPLAATQGMLFPYTPQISFTQAVNYMDLQLVHSNTDYAAYTRTPSVTISISGKFTVQNQTEGQYALACLHFLRVASKCYFGQNDPNAGLPPPVLTLNGYGNYMFNNLRVILKSHNWSFDDSADGIDINFGGGNRVRLPALFTVSCELMVVQTPQRMREEFNFSKFATGELMQSGNVGWI